MLKIKKEHQLTTKRFAMLNIYIFNDYEANKLGLRTTRIQKYFSFYIAS